MSRDPGALLPEMMEARDRFMELVDGIRPELHRYCARMTGSVFDGEDVVQDTLAKAYYALGQMLEPPNLRPWLFRIAHNTAMDFLKRYERTHVEPVAELPETAPTQAGEASPELLEAALGAFARLPPVQRSALVLKDVLGHSLEETAATMGVSVGAVKAALMRARTNVARRTDLVDPVRETTAEHRALVQRYAALFNANDWDGLRALLSQECHLDLVSRVQRRAADAGYYDRYAAIVETEPLRARAAMVDGAYVVAIFRPPEAAFPAYFIALESLDDRIASIRDFRYVPYISRDARYADLGD